MAQYRFQTFDLNQVSITGGVFRRRADAVRRFLLEFDLDRLMHTFRLNAGLPSSAEPLGGWEGEQAGIRGHCVGHYLSAVSKYYGGDHDQAFKDRADRIVAIMGECVRDDGYLSAFPSEVLDQLESWENHGVEVPYYTLHKILQGLLDAHRYVGNRQALELALNLGHYIGQRFEKLSAWKTDGVLRATKVDPTNEFGGIGDALYTLYDLTGDEDVLRTAGIFDRDYFTGALSRGEDVLEDLHANTHLPMIIAALHRYDITHDIRFLTAATNGYRFIAGRMFANGNTSSKASHPDPNAISERAEHWGAYGDLSGALTGGESESCCAHNLSVIARRLFEIIGDVTYLRELEQLKFNAVINCLDERTGQSLYHQPLGVGVHKKFGRPYLDFWCCTGTGWEAGSHMQRDIWFHSTAVDGVVSAGANADAGVPLVVLAELIPSRLDWAEAGIGLTLDTDWPNRTISSIDVAVHAPTRFTLAMMADRVSEVTLTHGRAMDERETAAPADVVTTVRDGLYLFTATFHDGDRVALDLRADIELVPLPGDSTRQAVRYGNVLLASLGGAAELGPITVNELDASATRHEDDRYGLSIDVCPPHVANADMLRLVPIYAIADEEYSVYLNVNDAATASASTSPAVGGRTESEATTLAGGYGFHEAAIKDTLTPTH